MFDASILSYQLLIIRLPIILFLLPNFIFIKDVCNNVLFAGMQEYLKL